jgi:hypothetical protein
MKNKGFFLNTKMTLFQDHSFVKRMVLCNFIIHKVDCDFFFRKSDILENMNFLYIQKLLITGGTSVSDRRSRLALRV